MSEVPYPMLVATNERLEAKNQRLREELRSEQMERSDAEREADRLRAGIEKLRDECGAIHGDSHASVEAVYGGIARRLTDLLAHGDET